MLGFRLSPVLTHLPVFVRSHILLGLLLGGAGLARAADFVAYTSTWPPLTVLDQGHVTGLSTELLREACTQVHLDCQIELMPWARAYVLAQRTPNSLVYATVRTPEREDLFIWVGPIAVRHANVWSLTSKKTHRVRELGDLAGLRVGVVRGDALIPDLLNAGVPANAIEQDRSNVELIKLLLRGWVDVIIDNDESPILNLQKLGQAPSTVNKLLALPDSPLYFAFNKRSDPAAVQRLRQAVDDVLKTSGARPSEHPAEHPAERERGARGG